MSDLKEKNRLLMKMPDIDVDVGDQQVAGLELYKELRRIIMSDETWRFMKGAIDNSYFCDDKVSNKVQQRNTHTCRFIDPGFGGDMWCSHNGCREIRKK